jgi:carbon-monoxide dehydrogenase medium subunit
MFQNVKEYYFPKNLRDALAKLGKNRSEIAVPFCGAFHLVRTKLNAATSIVDISRLGLDYVKVERGTVRIGGTASFQQIVASPKLNSVLNGLLPKSAQAYSSKIQRNATTLQDVLFGWATYFDLLTALVALDTQVTVQGRAKKSVPLAKFFQKDKRAVLGNKEIAAEFSFRIPSGHVGASLQRLAVTDSDTVAILNVVAILRVDGRKCVEARIAVGGGLPVPVRLTALEKALAGKKLDAAMVESVSGKAADLIQPISDFRGSASYRRQISGVLVRRALEEAYQNATGKAL